jgi:hypothetical protein
LKWDLGLSARQVSASLKIAHSTVEEYLKRVEQAGLDWSKTEVELQQKGVTRILLWQEYRDEHLDGYSYSQFCMRFRRCLKTQAKTVMRIPKMAGEEVHHTPFSQDLSWLFCWRAKLPSAPSPCWKRNSRTSGKNIRRLA